MLLFYLTSPSKIVAGIKALNDSSIAFVDGLRGPPGDCCPVCKGTDYYNGYGTCQECDPM